jgi:hypothetical protein
MSSIKEGMDVLHNSKVYMLSREHMDKHNPPHHGKCYEDGLTRLI